MFRMTTEVSGKYRQFASANVSTSSQHAYITVNYHPNAIGVQISERSCYMHIAQTKQFTALVYPVNLADVEWTSSNPGIASVNQLGLVTASSAGNTTITVRSRFDTTKYDTCSIQVVSSSVTSVTLNYTTVNIARGKYITA